MPQWKLWYNYHVIKLFGKISKDLAPWAIPQTLEILNIMAIRWTERPANFVLERIVVRYVKEKRRHSLGDGLSEFQDKVDRLLGAVISIDHVQCIFSRYLADITIILIADNWLIQHISASQCLRNIWKLMERSGRFTNPKHWHNPKAQTKI
jgi:hypothetical protein